MNFEVTLAVVVKSVLWAIRELVGPLSPQLTATIGRQSFRLVVPEM